MSDGKWPLQTEHDRAARMEPARVRPMELLRRCIAPRWALGFVGALAVAAGGFEQPAFGVACLAVAASYRDATERQREWSALLSYGVTGWSIFGLLPVMTIGERLGGPYGGHPVFFVLQAAISFVNGWALQRNATLR